MTEDGSDFQSASRDRRELGGNFPLLFRQTRLLPFAGGPTVSKAGQEIDRPSRTRRSGVKPVFFSSQRSPLHGALWRGMACKLQSERIRRPEPVS